MKKLFFVLMALAVLGFGLIDKNLPPGALHTEPAGRFKVFTMAVSKQVILDWAKPNVKAVLFSEVHNDRLFPKDEIRITNYVYDKNDSIVDKDSLISMKSFINIGGDKQFASSGYNRREIEELAGIMNRNNMIKYFLFMPEEYRVNKKFIMYKIVPADKDFNILNQVSDKDAKALELLALNPSPPAKPKVY